jgi:hypothetical protein
MCPPEHLPSDFNVEVEGVDIEVKKQPNLTLNNSI